MGEKKRDASAPAVLIIEVKTTDGKVWATFTAGSKEFKTGSVGFYAGEKMTNPTSGERYQVGINITLIGSKG